MAPGTPPGTPPGLGRVKLARQIDMPDKFVLQNGKCRAKTHPACDTAAQTHESARHPPLLRDNFVAQKGKCRAKTHPACDTAAQTHEFARHPPLLRDNFVAQIKIVAQKRPRVRQPSSVNNQCHQVLTSRQNPVLRTTICRASDRLSRGSPTKPLQILGTRGPTNLQHAATLQRLQCAQKAQA